ncbi:MAG: polyamine aminopropyltransferase [Endozoicomonadaceae bacterium]|nr:polyamine aminopropyltransferase [Endozoicomonadaceae bacterium]MBE8232477.1 polyamine aminopropyltransferase [Endozoicomonadaceae bacterium]
MASNVWIEEVFQDIVGARFKVNKILFSGTSAYQTVDIVETVGHGRALLNDGCMMLTERDEYVYHEMIAHPPLFVHPNPKNVLIIGGGDGGTAREVIKHPSVERCVVVEIDNMVVQACQEYLPKTAQAFSDPKVQLHIADGVEFINQTTDQFDVILIDSTDPIGPSKPLFGLDFYRAVFQRLTPDGIVVSQGESPWYCQEVQIHLLSILKELFQYTSIYNFNNLSYPGGLWSFTFASPRRHPWQHFDHTRYESLALNLQYYNDNIHHAAFALPTFMNRSLNKLINHF